MGMAVDTGNNEKEDKEDNRERRLADASKLLDACRPYGKVENKARIAAIHNELMYAIDSAIRKNNGHRFQKPEIDIIKDVAFHIIYVLDGMHKPNRGMRAIVAWFRSLSTVQKLATIGAICTTLLAIANSGFTVYEKAFAPARPQSPALTAPAPKSPPSLTPSNRKEDSVDSKNSGKQ